MFEKIYKSTLSLFTNDQVLINKFWTEIASHYSKRNRHYHTLQHLQNLSEELARVKDKIDDWQVMVFSIAYHDIIYNPSKHDNEEKSAGIAFERLSAINMATDRIDQCSEQIIATKSHNAGANTDINYFTDADLAILGSSYFNYRKYTEQVRKEYSIYPDFLYRPGRQKVLKHFLEMPAIYKTAFFNERYEQQARNNILYELKELQQ